MDSLRSVETFEPRDLMEQHSIPEDTALQQFCFKKLSFCSPKVCLYVFVFFAV